MLLYSYSQLDIMESYVDIIGLCHSVAILWEIYVMRLYNTIQKRLLHEIEYIIYTDGSRSRWIRSSSIYKII